MSNRLFSLLLVVAGMLVCYLIASESPTDETWRVRAPGEITTQPAAVGNHFLFLIRQQQICSIDQKGTIKGPIQLPSQARHPLVGLASGALVADRDGGYTLYTPELKELWKRATLTPSDVSPVTLPENRVIVSGAREVLFALDGATGEPIWESHFEGRVVHVAASETIAVVYGYDDLKKPSWKLCAIDPEAGDILWTYKDPVEDALPFVYGGYFIFCDGTGRPVAVDQQTGEVVYRHDSDGYRIAAVTGNSLLLLAAGGSRLDCSDLPTGKSWSVTLPSPFLDALAVGDALLFADGRGIKCLDAKIGTVRWQRDLGKTFDHFTHGMALGITYKENFLARQTMVTVFTAEQNKTIWTAIDKGRFYKPLELSNGDMLVCRSGNIRLLPHPAATAGAETIASGPTIEIPISKPFWQIPGTRPQNTASSATQTGSDKPLPESAGNSPGPTAATSPETSSMPASMSTGWE